MKTDPLRKIVEEQKQGIARGIYAVCSANRYVIEACMQQAIHDGSYLLVESTSNQVNQIGGYMGMTPEAYASYVRDIAAHMDFPGEKVILGGDHLGPNPWQSEAESSAIGKACRLVADCVQAGYIKIHLDASMRLGDDKPNRPPDPRLAARRAAELCFASEQACLDLPERNRPLYVIGTEVPPPGGAQQKSHASSPTSVESAQETMALTQKAFLRRGLEAAWDRVIALVVQPGVEFADLEVSEYHRAEAEHLSRFIETVPGLVYEAHSTDYQRRTALKQMVEDHFAILKVGPELTYAFREAVFALAEIEREWLEGRPAVNLSQLIETLNQAMLREPRYWKSYYQGSAQEVALARKYSYSDRIRYYWPDPEVARSLQQLLVNLEQNPAPLTLIRQYFPVQYGRLRDGLIDNRPGDLVRDRIREVAWDYAWACGLAKV
jgi:D-tagatose-1,6-bisphosphate aldolase subunit GatZ/KbaZ